MITNGIGPAIERRAFATIDELREYESEWLGGCVTLFHGPEVPVRYEFSEHASQELQHNSEWLGCPHCREGRCSRYDHNDSGIVIEERGGER